MRPLTAGETTREDAAMKDSRGIDHLVIAVRDLEIARQRYAAMGFTTTPVAEHPWGTINSLVQLQGNFLELLAVGDPERIVEPGPGEFSFGAFNQQYLKQREGFSQLVFEGHDSRGDRAEFESNGLDTYDNFDFSRQAQLPDGSSVEVAFSLAFVTHPQMPEVSFFTCQQHAPEYFWKEDFQRHANTARQVTEVVIRADDPGRFAGFFENLQGSDAVTSTDDALTVSTARGIVSVLSPAVYDDRFNSDLAEKAPDGPYLGAYQITVADLGVLRDCLDKAGIGYRGGYDRVQVSANDAFGITLEFVA